MKDFETYSPLWIHSAKGSYLYTDRGPIIDAISSWWCKSLGHGHEEVLKTIGAQLKNFEHVIGAGTCFTSINELAEELSALTNLQHLFFASDGSSAIEIALKLALQACQIRGETKRTQFLSLKNSYHGETLGALSVSGLNLYKNPYSGYGYPCIFLEDIPYVNNTSNPLWDNCEVAWTQTLKKIEPVKENICALIVEPLVQGAGGMLLYSKDFLRRLYEWAKKNDIYIIADEIMTGFARTGKWFASDYVDLTPDILCVSKGITSGSLPLSVVLIDHAIYSLFYSDYDTHSSFLHSHTYSGNALAVSAALATIRVMRSIDIQQKVQAMGELLKESFVYIAEKTQKLIKIRSLGGWVAGDLVENGNPRLGFSLQKEALQKGALLRPLGNTVYWLPSFLIDENTIGKLMEITLNSIETIYKTRG
ncbi:adenosylmethionine--8-amino-7-oxononanoate transaminase [Legionella adelaidensis]|nr:adenosylmethionine--8-amino-7-oxononanoate transaminase [Legionella adelaidensis]